MPRSRLAIVCTLVAAAHATAATLLAQTRDEKVRIDRASVLDGDYWVYNDLAKGRDLARRHDKPLMVVLRCIP
jgi:serine protease Do